jgi:hypothetical protein
MKKYTNQIIIVVAFTLLLISYKLGVFGYVLAFYLGFGVFVLISFLGAYLDGKQKFKEIDDELLRIYKAEQENGKQ